MRKGGPINPMRRRSLTVLEEYITTKLQINNVEEQRRISARVLTFCSDLQKKWITCQRNSKKLYSDHPAWLEAVFITTETHDSQESSAGSRRGRPPKCFEFAGAKTKKRRLQQLLQSHSTSELSYATRLSLRSSGKRHAAEIVKAATDTTPTRAAKIRKAYKTSLEKTTSVFTPEEALAMLIDLKLTKNQYILLRKRSRDKGIDMYPSYEAIKKAKEECYPQKESITITESSAEVRLQDLLDCTVQRIATVQKEVLKQCAGDLFLSSIECIYKWGLDGSSGQSQYKQRFTETSAQSVSDADLLLTSIVPIQM